MNVGTPMAVNRDGSRPMHGELFVSRDVMSGPARVYISVSAALCLSVSLLVRAAAAVVYQMIDEDDGDTSLAGGRGRAEIGRRDQMLSQQNEQSTSTDK